MYYASVLILYRSQPPEQAAGRDRNKLQWQKYEDTTTGYWLAYAPFAVRGEPPPPLPSPLPPPAPPGPHARALAPLPFSLGARCR